MVHQFRLKSSKKSAATHVIKARREKFEIATIGRRAANEGTHIKVRPDDEMRKTFRRGRAETPTRAHPDAMWIPTNHRHGKIDMKSSLRLDGVVYQINLRHAGGVAQIKVRLDDVVINLHRERGAAPIKVRPGVERMWTNLRQEGNVM